MARTVHTSSPVRVGWAVLTDEYTTRTDGIDASRLRTHVIRLSMFVWNYRRNKFGAPIEESVTIDS